MQVSEEGRGGKNKLILIQVSPSDHGSWTCVLTLDTDFEQQKTFVDLEVAVKPLVSLIEAVDNTTNHDDDDDV